MCDVDKKNLDVKVRFMINYLVTLNPTSMSIGHNIIFRAVVTPVLKVYPITSHLIDVSPNTQIKC